MIDTYTRIQPPPVDMPKYMEKLLGWESAYTCKREAFGTKILEGHILELGDRSMNGGTGDSNG